MKPICLTIAGADPTSGAGIQADIRTFDRCGVHPFSVITAITFQTANKLFGYKSLSDDLESQLDALLTTYPIKYTKIGMVPDFKTLDIIIKYIKKYNFEIVFDPVSISSAGGRLSSEGLEIEIEKKLFPYVKIITPNKSEAIYYSNREIYNTSEENIDNLKKVAEILLKKLYGDENSQNIEKAVVIKSAISSHDEVMDLVLINRKKNDHLEKEFQTFKKNKIPVKGNIHGTGCVFSSAITAFLAKQYSIKKAISKAESFFNEKFQNFIQIPKEGKIIDLTIPDEHLKVINQIKQIYNFIAPLKKFSNLIPEVRMNISCSLPNAKSKTDIAGVDGRITVRDGYPYASGDISFGVSNHTARLLLTAKKFDNSVNIVMNLKYNPEWIKALQNTTDLELQEIHRELQPNKIMIKEESTMQWIIKESLRNLGEIPDIIWDKGSMGKEPMMRLFGKRSEDIIKKLKLIIETIKI